MVFAVTCGDDEEEPTAVPAAAPAEVAVAPPTPVPAIAAATAAKAAAHLKMAQSDDTNTAFCGESDAVPAVMFGKAFCDAHIDFIQDELVGRLAISWESNADATEWTYQFRLGVKFHNGKPFDAEVSAGDLNYKRTSTEPLGGWNFGIYGKQLENVEATGPFEVTLTMKNPSPIWPLDETWWDGGVSDQSLIDEIGLDAFREAPIGTGPFKFISWERLNKVEMEANRDWWAPEALTTPERVTVFTIPEAATRLAALLTKEIDWLINPLTPQIEIIEASADHRVLVKEQYDVNMMRFNWYRQPVLREKRLRQAIDREAITQDVFLGTAQVLRNHLPTTSKYNDPNDPIFPKYDPENAKRLVAELKAGGLYNDEPIGLMSPRNVYNEDVRATQAIVGMLKEAGINGVAEILDSAIRSERSAQRKCDWDLGYWLPVDGYGDMAGWLWLAAGSRGYGDPYFCFREDESVEDPGEAGTGDWGDPDLNEWIRLGALAAVMPVGDERDAAWLEALQYFNDAYIHQGL